MTLRKITTLEEFREAKYMRDGYIVIVDSTGSKTHMPSCADVDIAHFREKVVDNLERNGGYYLVDDLVVAAEEFKAKKCLNCRPR